MNPNKNTIQNPTGIKIIGIIVLFSMVVACQSLLEQDITGDTVTLNSPPNGLHSEDYTQTFWWDDVKGASSYNLQVVSPSFDFMQKMVLDTNITDNQFTYSFYPDTFTCRIKAYNAAYETAFTYATFYIDSTEGPQIVVLKEPYNNSITNDSNLVFSWYKAENATNYRVLIKEGEDVISTIIAYETSIKYPDNLLETPLLVDGEYTWTVRSENEVGYSEYAAARSIMIDRIAPGTPTVIRPVNQDTIGNFEMAWKHGANSGSAISDSIIVYKDSTSNIEYLSLLITDTVFTHSGSSSNKWYSFKIKAVDAATNQSGWSPIRYFYYQATTEGNK